MWYNAFMSLVLRSPLHGLLSGNMLIISYSGRKSGKRYSVPASYVRDAGMREGDVLWVTSLRERTWWRNLVGGANVVVRLRGRDIAARAEAFTDDAAVRDGLMAYLNAAPRLARFFGVALDAQGKPDMADIARVAQKRVVVRIEPA